MILIYPGSCEGLAQSPRRFLVIYLFIPANRVHFILGIEAFVLGILFSCVIIHIPRV